jgi:hypothetical protein
MIAKLFSFPSPVANISWKIFWVLFIIQKCSSKPVHPPPPQPIDASYAPDQIATFNGPFICIIDKILISTSLDKNFITA